MSRLRGGGLALAALVAMASAAALATPSPSAASGSTFDVRIDRPAAEVSAYWTAERMKSARSLSSAPFKGGRNQVNGAPGPRKQRGVRAQRVKNQKSKSMRRHGRVFISVPGYGDFSCSGTAVKAPNRSLVWTAAHCLTIAELGVYVDNFAFVPAYKNGRAPYGIWPASRMMALRAWLDASGLFGLYGSQLDYGAAIVEPNSSGRRLQQVVGARKMAFGTNRDRTYRLFGYPATGRFDGEIPYTCNSPYRGADRQMPRPRPMGVICDMTGGSSGGAWIGGRGRVASVTSYGTGGSDVLMGPYQGRAAKRLYRKARSVRP